MIPQELLRDPAVREALRVVNERLDEYVKVAREKGVGPDGIARAKMLAVGEMLLALDVHERARREPVEVACPQCGETAKRKQRREREIASIVGPIRYSRSIYRCSCGNSFAPIDDEFGLVEGVRESRALRELMAYLYADAPTDAVRENIEKTLGFAVATATVHRVAQVEGQRAHERLLAEAEVAESSQALDPVCPPGMAPSEAMRLPGATGLRQGSRALLQMDGCMLQRRDLPEDAESNWSEVRVAVCSDLAARTMKPPSANEIERAASEQREPRGREVLTRKAYVASRSLDEFRRLLWAESLRWRMSSAEEIVVVADGARWIWNLVAEQFASRPDDDAGDDDEDERHDRGIGPEGAGPRLVEILDWKHAEDHLRAVAQAVFGANTSRAARALERWRARLWHRGDTAYLADLFERLATKVGRNAATISRREATYFTRNASRCNYPWLRARGYPISSGAVEGACRNHLQRRLKQAGMRWSAPGLDTCLALRTYRHNHRWPDLYPEATHPQAA